MDRHNPFEGLDLDDQSLLNEQIDAIAFVELNALEGNGERLLPLNKESLAGQCIREHRFIHGLEQSRAKALMNMEAAIDCDPCKLFKVFHAIFFAPLRLCVNPLLLN
jgi:hypothetical protein